MGYVGEGRVLATARLYTRIYEFRPLSEKVTTLRLSAAEALYIRVLSYRGCEPLCKRGGVAYIECADPSQPSVTRGFNEN